MPTLTLTEKGQITLRKELLQHLGVRPGDRITLEKQPDGSIEVRAARPGGPIAEVFDLLKRDHARSLGIADINRIAAEGWAEQR